MEPLPRPTQRPLDREEQKKAFEALQQQYAPPKQIVQSFPLQPIKPEKPIQSTQNASFRDMLKERGLQDSVVKVDEIIKEEKTNTTIKQFYCAHNFSPIRASFMGLPIRYKICSKCGVVK